MSTFARFVCSRFKADQLTLIYVDFYLATGRITEAEYACITDPDCSCDWSMAAIQDAVAPGA